MNSFGSRTVLLIALVAAIIGGIATYSVSALTSTAKTEVRITAQRVDDGRVEFALQQREDDGRWGERLLPSRRFFPAEGSVNRWANSTPLEIDSGIPFYVNTAEATRSVTVEEYLATCGVDEQYLAESGISLDFFGQQFAGAFDGDDEDGEGLSWETTFQTVHVLLTAMRLIEPPNELAEFHAAQVVVLTLLAQYAEAQPDDVEFNIWGLIVIGTLLESTSEDAEANLDPALRQRLIDAGCIEESDGSSEE